MANPIDPQSHALFFFMAAMMPEGSAMKTPTIRLATTSTSVGWNASHTRRHTGSWFR